MDMAKVFMSGRSQAVRLPQNYRFDVDEVLISRVGSVVMLVPKAEAWEEARCHYQDQRSSGRWAVYFQYHTG